jgi:DNA-binding NarL/FixJ family response regulator
MPVMTAGRDMLGVGQAVCPRPREGGGPAYLSSLDWARPIRILVADDHEVVRCGLRAILESHAGWNVVAEAADGRTAVARTVETQPDVAIVDDSLPLLGGIEVARQIRSRAPGTKVMIFAMHDRETLAYDLLEAGARAFLLKTDPSRNLIAAVEALADRRTFFTGSLSEKLLANALSPDERISKSPLSPKERVVVQLIAEGHSNKEMSAILNVSVKTIETHRGAAMRKLNVGSTAGLVRYAVRNQLVEA